MENGKLINTLTLFTSQCLNVIGVRCVSLWHTQVQLISVQHLCISLALKYTYHMRRMRDAHQSTH